MTEYFLTADTSIGDQDGLPQSIPQWSIDQFEMKLLPKQPGQKGNSDCPLSPWEGGKSLVWKGHSLYLEGDVSAQLFSRVWLFATRTVAHQRFPRQEYWSELLFPSPGDLPDSGIKPVSPASSTLADGFFTTTPAGKTHPVSSHKNGWQQPVHIDVVMTMT